MSASRAVAALFARIAVGASLALAPAALSAQDAQVVAALRGETGVDPDPGSLLATVSMLSVEGAPLGEALARLAERSRVQIAFSPSLLPAGLRVDCDCAALNLARTLDRLLADTGLGYVELGSQVVVVPRSGTEPVPPDALLRGRVRSELAVPVADATVRLTDAADTARTQLTGTDRLGYFAFHDLAAGQYTLSVARIGYALHQQQVEVAAGDDLEVAIQMAEQAVALRGVRVEAERSRRRAWFEQSAGATVEALGAAEVRAIPGLAEPDPLKAIDVLPGVTSMSDFGAAFNVRGGSADQNLYLLDGVPIFNPFHTMGLFSVFNADMVARAELQSGGFPAEYGGRVSSVLRIDSDLGDEELAVDAAVSLIASRAAVGGGIPDGAKSRLGLSSARWKASARRSYLDVLTRPLLEVPFPYRLQDAQAAFEAWTRAGDRIRLTSYLGRDVFDIGRLTVLLDGWEERFPAEIPWSWGNAAVGAAWTRPLRAGGALDVHASWSRADTDLALSEVKDARFRSRIRRAAVGADVERRAGPATRWKSGVLSTWMRYGNAVEGGFPELYPNGSGTGWGTAAYTQVNWRPNRRWLAEVGVRVDHWRAGDATATTTVSPRLAVKRFVRDGRWAVRAGGGRYTQFLHSVRDEQVPLGWDAWVLAGGRVPPVVSDQVLAGVEGWLGGGRGLVRFRRGVLPDLRRRGGNELGRRSARPCRRPCFGRRRVVRRGLPGTQERGPDHRLDRSVAAQGRTVAARSRDRAGRGGAGRAPGRVRPATGRGHGASPRAALGRRGRTALEPGHGAAVHAPDYGAPCEPTPADGPQSRAQLPADGLPGPQKRRALSGQPPPRRQPAPHLAQVLGHAHALRERGQRLQSRERPLLFLGVGGRGSDPEHSHSAHHRRRGLVLMRAFTPSRRRLLLAAPLLCAACGSLDIDIPVLESDQVVAEVAAIVAVDPTDPASGTLHMSAIITRYADGWTPQRVPGASVVVRGESGRAVRLAEQDDQVAGCVNPNRPARLAGTCYLTVSDPGAFGLGEALSMTATLPDGSQLVGSSRIPGAFVATDLALDGGSCRLAPRTNPSLRVESGRGRGRIRRRSGGPPPCRARSGGRHP